MLRPLLDEARAVHKMGFLHINIANIRNFNLSSDYRDQFVWRKWQLQREQFVTLCSGSTPFPLQTLPYPSSAPISPGISQPRTGNGNPWSRPFGVKCAALFVHFENVQKWNKNIQLVEELPDKFSKAYPTTTTPYHPDTTKNTFYAQWVGPKGASHIWITGVSYPSQQPLC